MTTINLGRVRPVNKGPWEAEISYEAYDFVLYNGSAYLALQDVPPNYQPDTQTTFWVLFGARGEQGPQGVVGATGGVGAQGPKGDVYTPSISSDGILSWTNDGGLENPDPVNVIGPQGPQGDPGPQGIPGPAGASGTTDYSQLENKPTSDKSLTINGGFADALATGQALEKKVGVAIQSFTDSEKSVARSNIGFIAGIEAWKDENFSASVDAYLGPILEELILENGGTQEEIDEIKGA